MNNIVSECESYLDNLRSTWLAKNNIAELTPGLNTISRRKVVIADVEHLETIHSEINEHRALVVFEVSRRKIIGSIHHCLGAELESTGQAKLKTKEELWNDGIP